MLVAVLLLACHAVDSDTGDTTSSADDTHTSADDTTSTDDTDTDTGTPKPHDYDGDGVYTPDDCDDYHPDVHPGATEVWNGKDDDCDGRSDGDGSYAGSVHVDATAVYEGEPYSYAMDCPTTLQRTNAQFAFVVTCTPDASKPRATQLLGDSFTVVQVENQATEGAWSGSVTVASSAGWDATGSGTLRWSGFDDVALTFSMSSFSLDMSGSGSVAVP